MRCYSREIFAIANDRRQSMLRHLSSNGPTAVADLIRASDSGSGHGHRHIRTLVAAGLATLNDGTVKLDRRGVKILRDKIQDLVRRPKKANSVHLD